jgi:hypothetical protein
MTTDEAVTILDNIPGNVVVPAAKVVQMLRAWKGVDANEVIDVLEQLRPSEVLEVVAFAERKIARRNRPR